MPLIKRRPAIRAYLPRFVVPGQSVTANIVLDAKRPVSVDGIDVLIEGQARTATGSKGSWVAHPVLRLGATLSAARVLPSGRTELACRFELPRNVPASFRGRLAWTDYVLTVRADIPWWPDATAAFQVDVITEPIGALPPAPVIYSSAPDGPRGSEPHAELSLADSQLVGGGVLRGAVALRNVEHAGYKRLEIALVGRETLGGTAEHARYAIAVPIEDPVEGEPIPFAMRLPPLAPTQHHGRWRLHWVLEMKACRTLARALTLDVPVVVLAGKAPADTRKCAALPAIGSERVEAMWRQVGEELGFDLRQGSLHAVFGEVTLELRREVRERGGAHLVAELGFPSLELGLDGGVLTGFRRVLGEAGLPEGATSWDGRHYLVGRDPAQARVVAGLLGNAVDGQNVADLSDERLVLELASAGFSPAPLRQLGFAAVKAARAIPRVRAAIPPPPGFDREAWAALAASLDGTLETARMAIAGSAEGTAVAVITEWQGSRAAGTRVCAHAPSAISERHAGELGPSAPVEQRPALPAEVRPVVDRVLGQATLLRIEPESVSAWLPVPLYEPARAARVLPDLVELTRLLASGAGAYR